MLLLLSSIMKDDYILWQVANTEKYFKRITTSTWIEYEKDEINNSKILARYRFLQVDQNEVILQNESTNKYLKLGPNCIQTGDSINQTDIFICNGSWIKYNYKGNI